LRWLIFYYEILSRDKGIEVHIVNTHHFDLKVGW